MADTEQQLPLFEAQAQWFHVFKEMIDSGDAAAMGAHAFLVYAVVKSYTNWKTGKSWPGVDLIVEKSGVSRAQVKRSLKVLEEKGYITKEKRGPKNYYTLREKIKVYKTEGDDLRPIAEASWDYLPSTVQRAVAELKNFVVTGDNRGVTVINIESLTINMQENHPNSTGTQNNVNAPVSPEMLPDGPVRRAWEAQRRMLESP